MVLTWILALDLGGLGIGAGLLFGSADARTRPWASEVRRLVGLGLLLLAAAVAGGTVAGSSFFALRLACHALFCVLAPLAIARGLVRRGAAGFLAIALGLAAEGAYVWAREVEPYRLEVTHHEIVSERL